MCLSIIGNHPTPLDGIFGQHHSWCTHLPLKVYFHLLSGRQHADKLHLFAHHLFPIMRESTQVCLLQPWIIMRVSMYLPHSQSNFGLEGNKNAPSQSICLHCQVHVDTPTPVEMQVCPLLRAIIDCLTPNVVRVNGSPRLTLTLRASVATSKQSGGCLPDH